MGWYDFFSRFYDRSLEALYVDARRRACEALELRPGQTVLDLPCGTGQSLDGLAAGVGTEGTVIGLDFSEGMLQRAKARVERNGWTQVHLGQADVHAVDAARLGQVRGEPVVLDRLHVFLGLTAFPRWEAAFERLWGLLRPGGRAVVVDCHAERPTFQGRMVNLVARAEIQRKVWLPLERLAEGYERRELPSRREHGGQLVLAVGVKPG
ncbi:class I SAM-dependent methyltransferase [Paraliomyxa miuraensis]|uniref:class I SAM-dependent methyltransferase n=1 Tax=Paraliomyxa miuraensis TaxID=376150 RepID=UPI0022547CFF|nr:methyltransferase domain-containing protein [Paraliomyxa miuraensis]MCX4241136.1 methyltransferase domain-containing protein [Paraliomyxa miuraensis]